MQNIPSEDLSCLHLYRVATASLPECLRKQADLCGFPAVDTRVSAIQQLTDGALAASTG